VLGCPEEQVANFNCNAGCAVPIAHHFITKLQDAKLPGCVVFTSSPAGFMACPFSAMYGATKAFLSNFATSLAAEVAVDGIDVMVVHPSPVQSNFYANTHKLDALEMFRKTGKAPNVVTDSLFATVGRAVVCDQGYYSITLRIVLKVWLRGFCFVWAYGAVFECLLDVVSCAVD
jgi:short-subunit dehydrogenase